MAYYLEDLLKTAVSRRIGNRQVVARPIPSDDIPSRLRDAWLVLIGKADAVIFEEVREKEKSA